MKVRLLFSLFSCWCILSTTAQDHGNSLGYDFKVSGSRDGSFYYTTREYGYHYVEIVFSNLSNTVSNGYRRSVYGQSGNLFNLKPIDGSKPIGYDYKYYVCRGKYPSKINRDFVYQCPTRINSPIHTKLVETGENGLQIHFLSVPGDSVFAMRRGVIVETSAYEREVNYTFKGSSNYVLIEHRDGSFARYVGFEDEDMMQNPGTPIIPRQYLGRSKGIIHVEIYQMVDYNMERHAPSYEYFLPKLRVDDGVVEVEDEREYIPKWNQEDILAEFSKRERKKYFKSQTEE